MNGELQCLRTLRCECANYKNGRMVYTAYEATGQGRSKVVKIGAAIM